MENAPASLKLAIRQTPSALGAKHEFPGWISAPASLKPVSLRVAQRDKERFPGRKGPGFIEALFSIRSMILVADFRGGKAPASLKRTVEEAKKILAAKISGVELPGLIEATGCRQDEMLSGGFRFL